MKSIINTLFATVATALTASASPSLLVETTITAHHSQGDKSAVTVPRETVESGKPVTIQVGKVEYSLTATLNEDGYVDLSTVFAEREGDKAGKLVAPRMRVKLGQVAEIQIGQVAIKAKTTLAK